MGWFSDSRTDVDPDEWAAAVADGLRRGGADQREIEHAQRQARRHAEQSRRRAAGEAGRN